MNTFYSNLRTTFTAGLLTFLLGISQTAHAALAIPDEPLLIGAGPQPNIFFALDDSGSMDWDEILNAGTWAPGAAITGAFVNFIPANGAFGSAWDREFRRLSCRGYNVMAYDPTFTYDPWPGVDSNGVPFTDQTLASARLDPYTTTTRDISNHIYFAWNDADGDGEFDGPFGFQAPANAATDECGDVSSNANGVAVNTLTPSEQTNYANWFTYFRKREYVLKRAVSELITNSQAFMGLATMHDNNTVGTPVRDMSVQANKDTLLDELFQVNSSGDTPLRSLLDNAGKYFDDTDGSNAPAALGFTDPSPILPKADGGECQQNFTVLMSDGFWNGGNPSGIGNEDGDDNTNFDGGPHADTLSNTAADIAMKYYEKDLSSLDDLVPTVTGVDDNPAQHLVTYSVAFGLAGTGLTTPPDHDPATPAPPWTDAINQTGAERLDDMQHAAFNGRGLFLNAKDPQTLISSLSSALTDVEQRTTFSASAVAVNSTVLRTSSRVFQAQFDSSDYSGELSAFSLNPDGTLDQEIWKATNNFPTVANRDIFTTVSKAGTPTAIEFLSTDADLVTAVGSAAIINYIRGDQSNEQQNGGAFRDRNILLGDIVNSSPLSVGQADFGYDALPGSEGTDYPAFLSNKVTRFTDANGDPFSVVYAGSNDGMLHAFDARNGAEQFVYIPSTVHGNLNLLTDPNYGHKFFVDATPSSADAFIGGVWKTMLIGALGAGGRTIYALDITDPFSFGISNVMWEFTSANNNEMGFVLSEPQLVRLNNGRWGVIFGNGYNSNSGKAQLFILDAEDGSVIKIINTGVGSLANTNGLAMPFILDSNSDAIADTVYAGDLQGNLWKFDISGSNPAQWNVAFKGPPANSPKPLYTALDTNGNPQPVTTQPSVVNHPDGGFVVLFGSGKFIENSDNTIPANPQVQTFYGVRDNSAALGSGRVKLQEQQILEEVDLVDGNGAIFGTGRIVSTTAVDYANKDGWFMDLVSPVNGAEGERVISDPAVRFGRVIFNTFIPKGICEQGGTSFIMELDAVNGNRLENATFDTNNDGIIDSSDTVQDSGGNSVVISGFGIVGTTSDTTFIQDDTGDSEHKLTSGVTGEVTSTLNGLSGVFVGRQSWRQLR